MSINVIQSDLSKELGQNFINYAAAVNGDRANPDARTGLKPVARRIMFIMDDEGISSSKPHTAHLCSYNLYFLSQIWYHDICITT